jgi:ABC-type amino acid transport substrate-binding protein
MRAAIPFLILLMCYTFGQAQLKGDSWQKTKGSGKGTITVVFYEQPGLIQQVDGEMKGVCVELLSEFKAFVKKKYDKDVEINYAHQEKEFSKFLKTVQNTPNILGVTNTSVTEERKKIFKFTPPYMATPLVFLTNEKAPPLRNLADLSKVYKGYTAEVITGSTHVSHIEKIRKEHYPDLNITYALSSESVIKNLSTNPKLFSILDFTEYVGVVRKNLPIKRQEVDLGNYEDLAFIMSRQSDWDVVWNEFLTPEFRKSPTYKKIIKENLGSTFINLVR